MTVTRVTLGHTDGQFDEQQMPSVKGVASSEDYHTDATQVERGGMKVAVQSAADLQDSDVVTIDGVPMSVGMAKSVGVIDRVFGPALRSPEELDPGLSVGAAAAAGTPKSNTGNPTYDEAVDGLNEAMDAGSLEFAEAQTYDTAAAQIAMAGLDMETVAETVEALEAGELQSSEIDQDHRAMLEAVQSSVRAASTKSAMAELGPDGFEELKAAAAVHPGVHSAIYQYAADRARGRTGDITWSDLHAHILEQLGR